MDTRLLKHYEKELTYLRDMGAEFSEAYPKIASRLGMSDQEVSDPYVEQLLEGVAFLSARVQLELELEFPKFTNQLFELIYPHYIAATPSMMIAMLEPDITDDGLEKGYTIQRHTQIRTDLDGSAQTPCVFRTCDDLNLLPISVSEVEYLDGRASLVAAGVTKVFDGTAALRIRLKRDDGQNFDSLNIDTLSFFINGQGGAPWNVHEMLCCDVTGIVFKSTDRRAPWTVDLVEGNIEPKGFSDSESLLPSPDRTFSGYRLLQEYFAMPERFHFINLNRLSAGMQSAKQAELDIFILFKDGNNDLASEMTKEMFVLNAVPAVNLFEKRFDRVPISSKNYEHHVIPDRTAPLDFEVFSILGVDGIGQEGEDEVLFKPFFSAEDATPLSSSHPAFYTQRRDMRQRTEKERLQGVRTSYLGSELYLSLVDPNQAPYSENLDQLSVRGLVSNRDLPLLIPKGSSDIFFLPEGGPVSQVHQIVGPTRPKPTLVQGDTAWRLISHLSLNYLSIAESAGSDGAANLKELIGLYASKDDRSVKQQIEGLVSVESRSIVRRIKDRNLSTAVKGLEIKLTFDDSFFEGSSAYLLASVLEKFFQKYVSINSFTETVYATSQRGEIKRWKPQVGTRHII